MSLIKIRISFIFSKMTSSNNFIFYSLFTLTFTHYARTEISSAGVPPGVNPEYYNNVQFQQPHGAVPVNAQAFGGQPSVHQGGHFPNQQASHTHQQVPHTQHGTPNGRQPVLNAANIQHEKEHIAEHMEVPLDTSKMSEQELQFHYFKMHDSDNNNKLDGCELIKSLIHWHEQGHDNAGASSMGGAPPQPKLFADDELIQLIDPILNMDDTNQDGYIDYAEFIRAQQKVSTH